MSEDEPGFRIATCDECRTYIKVVESPVLKEMTLDLADMVSLPLDIVAQEKGYLRPAPNPISLKKWCNRKSSPASGNIRVSGQIGSILF